MICFILQIYCLFEGSLVVVPWFVGGPSFSRMLFPPFSTLPQAET